MTMTGMQLHAPAARARRVVSAPGHRPLLLAAVLCLLGGACTAQSVGVSEATPLPKFLQLSEAAKRTQEYRVVPGDQLTTRCYYNPQLDEEVLVRPDGNISL